MTWALAGKESIPLTPIALGSWVDLGWFLTVLLSEVTGFALEEPISLTLAELEAGLLKVGKNQLKLAC